MPAATAAILMVMMVVLMVVAAMTVVMTAVGVVLVFGAALLPAAEDDEEKRRQQDECEKDYDFHNSENAGALYAPHPQVSRLANRVKRPAGACPPPRRVRPALVSIPLRSALRDAIWRRSP